MKITSLSSLEKMVALSVSFTMIMLLARFGYTGELTYGFYIWNTFLALLPLLFSRLLKHNPLPGWKAYLLLAGWLGFFPNAAYIVTDLLHYTDRPPVPLWFDTVLVTMAAWNGLLLGIISLMQVEQFLSNHFKRIWVNLMVILSCILCGYGVYLGRYLRFNTWDVVTNPFKLLSAMAHHALFPFRYMETWTFTLLFGFMFGIVYFTLKSFSGKSADIYR